VRSASTGGDLLLDGMENAGCDVCRDRFVATEEAAELDGIDSTAGSNHIGRYASPCDSGAKVFSRNGVRRLHDDYIIKVLIRG
jgi:hypothetical protein